MSCSLSSPSPWRVVHVDKVLQPSQALLLLCMSGRQVCPLLYDNPAAMSCNCLEGCRGSVCLGVSWLLCCGTRPTLCAAAVPSAAASLYVWEAVGCSAVEPGPHCVLQLTQGLCISGGQLADLPLTLANALCSRPAARAKNFHGTRT